MKIVYSNHVDDATITASSEAVGFETSNLQDVRASRVYRSTSTSDSIVFDFGSAVAFSGVGIAGHNITSGATVTLEWNDADSWGSPAGSKTITVKDTMVEVFTSVTYQYARLSVTDSGNSDGYIEMGRVAIGAAMTDPDISIEAQFPRNTTTTRSLSRGRQLYVDEGVRYRAATVTWPRITSTQRDDFVAVFNAADVKPIFVDFEATDSGEAPMYCYIDGSLDLQYNDGFRHYELTMNVEEVY